MVNHCKGHVIFQDIEHQVEENILHPIATLFIINLS